MDEDKGRDKESGRQTEQESRQQQQQQQEAETSAAAPDPDQSEIRGTSGQSSGDQIESKMGFERIAFIGAGNMAFAMAQGLVRSGRIDPGKQFCVFAPSQRNLPKFQQTFTCRTTTDLTDLTSGSPAPPDLLFLCVKPNILTQPLMRLTHDPLVISVAAGVSLSQLKQSVVAPDGLFVRIMTNTACALGASVCAVHVDPCIREDKLPDLKSKLTCLLSPLGEVHFVDETHLNTITALAGSGPAFSLMFLQALSDAGVKMGLTRTLSQRLAALTLSGAASLVLQPGSEHPIALRDRVCSPAGTTIYGIHKLEQSGFTAGIMDAIQAASERAEQLASGTRSTKS